MTIYYELASDGVIWEKIGDQIVMANLNSGRYCNIGESSGVFAWELMMMGASQDDVHQNLSEYFKEYDEASRCQIDAYFEKLVKLDFISIVLHSEKKAPIHLSDKKNVDERFSEPKILFYDDIDTLLQLDPIDDEVEKLMKEFDS